MKFDSSQDGDTQTITLEGECTIYEAAKLKDHLSKTLESADSITLDLSGITEIDASFIQNLISAKKEAVTLGKNLSLVRHSMPVLRSFDTLGLVGFFGDKIIIPKNGRKELLFKYGLKKSKV